MVNKDLLRATMDAVLAHPELHKQTAWAARDECGTAYCFAGMACHLANLEPDWNTGERFPGGVHTSWLQNGDLIADTAMRLLGIDYRASEHLFSSDNDVATLKDYVDQLCDTGRIELPDPWSE